MPKCLEFRRVLFRSRGRHHAGDSDGVGRPRAQNRQTPCHRVDAAAAGDWTADRRLHSRRRVVGNDRCGGRPGAAHQGGVAGEEGPADHRHRRACRPRRAALQGDRVGPRGPDARRAAAGRGGTRPRVVSDPRTRNVWRRWGYRLLPGDLFSYILHLRPAEWPIMAAHTAFGYVLAVGFEGVARGAWLPQALWALVIWVLFVNGGTLAINSVFDRDEGDIGYLNAPPQLPRYLLHFSLVLLVGGQLLALRLPVGFQIAYAICFVLSILYSVPPFRFKAVAGVDWVINMWGFGTFTPYAARAATGRPLGVRHGLRMLAVCCPFGRLHRLTQLYQFDEDRRRGDRTLALILGMRASLVVATLCTLLAFGLLAWAAIMLKADGRWLIAPLVLWLAVLLPWLSGHAAGSPKH